MSMKLKTVIQISKPYSGKSKFEFWKNLKIGDVLEVSLKFEKPGSFNSRNYATMLIIKKLNSTEEFTTSLSDMVNYISKIEYFEV